MIDLSTVDVHRFDSERDDQLVASGCLEQNLLNLTHHVVVIFAYKNKLMVGPAVILQSKRHESTKTEGRLQLLIFCSYQLMSINNNTATESDLPSLVLTITSGMEKISRLSISIIIHFN